MSKRGQHRARDPLETRYALDCARLFLTLRQESERAQKAQLAQAGIARVRGDGRRLAGAERRSA